MPERPRLKKGDITLREILDLSLKVYKNDIDNKLIRSKLDVSSAKIVYRRNMSFNQQTKQWEQTGREAKIQFLIKTIPESYVDNSGIRIHQYPVTFLFKSFEQGLDSPFRSRVGSLKKPLFGKAKKHFIKDAKDEKEADKFRQENARLTEENKKLGKRNILNGIQLQFFYDMEFVWEMYGLLWGPNYAKWAPKIKNPELIPYFSKHEIFIILKVLEPLFQKMQGFIKNRVFQNLEKPETILRQAQQLKDSMQQEGQPINLPGAGDLGF
jgi:hypothetical protein